MTRDKYEIEICAGVTKIETILYVPVAIGDWRPKVAECHANAETWARLNPGAKAIRGWVVFASYGDRSIGLTAHSIVEGPDGTSLDITPLHDENLPARRHVKFVRHRGDDDSFFAMTKLGLEIHCLGTAPAPRLDPSILLASWMPESLE